MTLLVEPFPGTQVIYEYIGDCASKDRITKVYPPHTTLIVHNACPRNFTILGEVTKLVVEYNVHGGWITLGVGGTAVLTE